MLFDLYCNMENWNAKLFDGLQNCQKLAFAFVPFSCCIYQVINARIVTKGDKDIWKLVILLDCCLPIVGCTINRILLRKKLKIDSDWKIDAAAWLYCPCYAVTQELLQTISTSQIKGSDRSLWRLWSIPQGDN